MTPDLAAGINAANHPTWKKPATRTDTATRANGFSSSFMLNAPTVPADRPRCR